MYLKRIELEGFKSFADRTVIAVERGLTGIVGPNGCGKSNVVDALLWVMGERSAKALRADAMDDVIFKGAEGRPGASYAMVEIVLGDDRGDVVDVDVGGEVAVGRRLFRTGESEFLHNGRKVRRKDVRDLLLDTGLGVRGYMLLAQGKIDAVLAANPAERRSVFEEAAGISRYKQRKHEARLKLGSVEQDLVRVDDVLSEVQRTVRSLRYQAGKAQRFVEMREEYRNLRVRVALGEDAGLREEDQRLRREAGELEAGVARQRDARKNAERQLDELRAEEELLHGRHDALRTAAGGAKERAAALEERVRGLEERANELEHREARERERLAALQAQGDEEQAGVGGLETDLAGLQKSEVEHEARLAAADAAFQAAREKWQDRRARIEELRAGVVEALQERTLRNNERAAVAEQRSAAAGGLAAMERRRNEIVAGRTGLAEERSQTENAARLAAELVAKAEGRAGELVGERDALRERLADLSADASRARQQAAEAATRLEALAAVDEELQGLPEQVRDLLHRPPEGVRGLVLEGVKVPAPWDRMVENLLGRMQHALWLDDRGRIRGFGAGCVDVFFPPEAAPAAVHLPAAQPLADMLEGDPERCRAIAARLGEAYCVPTAAAARELALEHPGALFLSADGEIHGRGWARVGILTGEAAAGMLARANAREAAQEILRVSQASEKKAAEGAADARAKLATVDEALRELETGLREALADRERASARAQDVERRSAALAEEEAALELEYAALQAAVDAATLEEGVAEAAREAAEARRAAFSGELEGLEGAEAAEDAAFEAARAALQEARHEGQRLLERQRHLEERRSEGLRIAARHTEEQRRLAQDIVQIGERLAALRTQAATERDEARGLLAERGGLEERVAEAAVQLERVRSAHAELRGRLEQGGTQLEELLGRRQDLALGLQRAEMQRAEIARGVVEEFQQALDDLAQSLGVDPTLPAFPDPAALEAAASQLADLRRRIEAVGAVNLEAVDELGEREDRLGFLERERQDLLQARGNLEDTLEELDGLCRARFLETFNLVQEHFESIFRRLFRGGRAGIQLAADEDPLDAGIEIEVRPPGKELRSINLLSGGERTLTAIALLLAVFRSRPSPFCLLDEVDAALDDANVERFLDVLVDFTADTQFMVVTHNKLTMGRCERLFGVTMRKPGVSLVVSVDLADIPEAQSVADALHAAPTVVAAPRIPGFETAAEVVAAARTARAPADEGEREAVAGG
ncbi:MAG TPA: chromosome segregation protein SMC [Planctomycetota bacterium]